MNIVIDVLTPKIYGYYAFNQQLSIDINIEYMKKDAI